MAVRSHRDEFDGGINAKHNLLGSIDVLYNCEGGDAEKTFNKLFGIFNKIKNDCAQ